MQEHVEKYLNLAYRYFAIRNRSEKEIREYLTKKKAESKIIEHIIDLLKKQKFLDDEVFAKGWIRSRARLRPKGKNLLKIELQQKGIAKEVIDKVVAEISEELPDEITQATRLIERRMEKLKGTPRQEIYNKVGSFLARRGFSWEIAKKAIDSYT